jgi:hypothetical protein
LGELAQLKMNMERDKESLRQRVDKLQAQLAEAEQEWSKRDEQARGEQAAEVARLNAKMKEMARVHASALDTLASHLATSQQQNKVSRVETRSCGAQTDTTFKDIELLEAFRQRYLDTLSRMKCKYSYSY